MTDERRMTVRAAGNVAGFLAVTLVLAALACASCFSEPSNEERLERARADLKGVREDVLEMQSAQEAARARVEKAERELADARKDLEAKEARLRAAAADARIDHAIEAALLAQPRLVIQDLDVQVRDGKVTVRGKLETDQDLEKVVQIIRATEGVGEVESHVKVKKPSKKAG